MKKILLFTLLIIFSVNYFCIAQTKFSRFFWRASESIGLNAIIQTSDGGYVLAGSSTDTAAGSFADIFLVKFNAAGDTVWTQRMGGSGIDVANAVEQTSDGGFIIAGYTNSSGAGGYDFLLVKTDSTGNVQWSKTYGFTFNEQAYSVKQNNDNGYIIVGNISDTPYGKMLVIRTDAAGNAVWTYRYWYGNGSTGHYGIQTSDGGFAVTGTIIDGSMHDFVLIKLTSLGSVVWSRNHLNGPPPVGYTSLVKQTLDGGYVLVSAQNGVEVYKFDSTGNLSFGTYLLPGNIYTSMARLEQLPDSSYLVFVSGNNPSLSTGHSSLIKLNSSGDTIGTKILNNIYCTRAIFTNDGSIAGCSYVTAVGGGMHKLDTTFYSECVAPVPSALYSTGTTTIIFWFPISSLGTPASVTSAAIANVPYQTRRLYSTCMPDVPVCIVSVDSATQYNMVVWEENFDTAFVDSYKIYKESSAAGIYNLIGTVPDNQLSTFLDVNSNPEVQPERYRVSAFWNNFYEPPNTSSGHKTIHLTANLGLPPSINLLWSAYSGFSYLTYNIWRGNASNASIIASVPFGTNSYTDLNPPPGDSLYFIEVVHTPCNPTAIIPHPGEGDASTREVTSSITGTRSNIINRNGNVGISELTNEGNIYLSPNPAINQITIYGLQFTISEIGIYNVLGEKIFNRKPEAGNQGPVHIDVSSLPSGIYFIKVKGENTEQAAKFIKQ